MSVDYFLLIGREVIPVEFAEYERCHAAANAALDSFLLGGMSEPDALAAKLEANAAEDAARSAFSAWLRFKAARR